MAQLKKVPSDLDPKQKIQCVWKLAEAYRFQQQPDQAISRLKSLLPIHKELEDAAGERTTLRMLASHYNASRQYGEAAGCLRRALELHDKVPEEDRLAQADLWSELADTCSRQRNREETDRCRDKAAELYTAALREPRAERRTIARTTTAFWKLELLYQKREQLHRALHLIEEQTPEWDRDTWMNARLKAEKGSLQLAPGLV